MGVMVDILGMLSYIAGSYLDYFITVLESLAWSILLIIGNIVIILGMLSTS